MTIKECIDAVDNLKPNQYTRGNKVQWLSFVDEVIINDVLKTHEGYDGRYDTFTGYTEDDLSVTLIVPSPYDRLYTAFIVMKIDQENGETARYNNSASLFNSYMMEYRKYYNKTHMPLSPEKIKNVKRLCKPIEHITEAQVEAIKRDLYYMLSDDLNEATSDDKMYDIVMKYVNNNVQMLKGKNGEAGKTPYIAKNGNWWIGDLDTGVKAAGVDGTVKFDSLTNSQKESLKGADGKNGKDGQTPYISNDGYWWIGAYNTGVKAEGKDGKDGKTPYIKNGNWWFGVSDIGVKAEGVDGKDGETPYIKNGNWWIGTSDTGVKAEGKDGETPDLTNYVTFNDKVTRGGRHGVVRISSDATLGLTIRAENDCLAITPADTSAIDKKTEKCRPITPYFLDYAIKCGLPNNPYTLTDAEKVSIANWLGAAQVEYCSYTGTGMYGASYPCSVSFSFAPDIVLKIAEYDPVGSDRKEVLVQVMCTITQRLTTEYKQGIGGFHDFNYGGGVSLIQSKKENYGKTISWYIEGTSTYTVSAGNQANTQGRTYWFLGIKCGGKKA